MEKLLAMFVAIFLAELGDKTQIATLLFASSEKVSPFAVFIAAAAALVLSTFIAVVLGSTAAKFLPLLPLKLISGAGFLAIGAWNLWEHFKAG